MYETTKITKVTTKDGSTSFFSEKYQETYHSISGTKEEAREKFVRPCNLKDGAKILDICFGIGYKTAVALEFAKNLEVIGLEIDPNIIKKSLEIESDLPHYNVIQKLAASENFMYHDEKCSIQLVIDDARITIKKLCKTHLNYFDAVFLDPFSPKACPELWTEEFFSDIYKCMKSGGVLTTYSCARVVRDNLKKAGFTVKDGPCIGRRAPSTVAAK